MFAYKHNDTISDAEIEEKARAMGMHFDDECKVIFGGDEKE